MYRGMVCETTTVKYIQTLLENMTRGQRLAAMINNQFTQQSDLVYLFFIYSMDMNRRFIKGTPKGCKEVARWRFRNSLSHPTCKLPHLDTCISPRDQGRRSFGANKYTLLIVLPIGGQTLVATYKMELLTCTTSYTLALLLIPQQIYGRNQHIPGTSGESNLRCRLVDASWPASNEQPYNPTLSNVPKGQPFIKWERKKKTQREIIYM